MVANIRGFTPNYGFKLINFDTPRWHTLEYSNWQQLDALLQQTGIAAVRGEWQNSTIYYEGDRAFDPDDGELYRALVQHTSAAAGTFAEERIANPNLWILQTAGVPLYRGMWLTGSSYTLGDIVVVNAYQYYLCTTTHIAGGTFPPDIANWVLVFDATAAVNSTTQSATDAANSATAAQVSQSAAAASATAASNSATSASGSATAAGDYADDAAASAAVASTQGARLQGTSTTPNTMQQIPKIFTTQAGKMFDPGTFLTIADAANPTVNYMICQSTAYVATTLNVNVHAVFGPGGTFSDWKIAVGGAPGSTGDVGPVGPPGPVGPAGAAGAVGPQGTQGIQGPKGDTGNTGPQGAKGDTGATGAASTVPGPVGPQGPVGQTGADSTVPGPVGPQGPQGDVGPQGPKGDTGLTGPAGSGSGDMLRSANLSDLVDKPTSIVNLGAVAKAGDTMTGMLTLFAAPTLDLHAATKKYVDDKPSGGGGTPGGATTQVQFNNAGAFGGSADLVWNNTLKDLCVTHAVGFPAVTPDVWLRRTNPGSMELWDTIGLRGSLAMRWCTVDGDVLLTNNGKIIWNNDTGLQRVSAGMVGVSSQTSGQFRDIKARTFIATQDPANPLELATKQYVDNKPSGGGGTAATTTFAPAGNIAATDVQAAIAEVDTEKVAKAGDTMTGALVIPMGTAAAPSIALTGFLGTGIYGTPGVGYLNTTVNGTNTVTFTTSAIQVNGGVTLRNQSGTVANPSYTFGADTNSGIYRESLQQICFGINGAKVWSWEAAANTSFQPLRALAGTMLAPAYSFFNDTTSGLYRKGAGTIALSAASADIMQWNNTLKLTTAFGPIALPAGDPADPSYAASKLYVDNKVAAGGAPASSISFTPAGNIAAATVQLALQELDGEKVAKTGDTMTGALLLPDGTAAAPALAFSSQTNTGIRYQAGQVCLVAQGATSVLISASSVSYACSQRGVDGFVGTPSIGFLTDPNTGLWLKGPDNPSISAGGVDVMNWSATSIVASQPLTLPAAPTADLQAATKKYVDDSVGTPATALEFRANSAPTKHLSSDTVWQAAAPTVLADTTVVAPDLSLGFDFTWTLGGGGRTLNNPTNLKPGQKGVIIVSGAASAAVTTYGTAWKFPGGTKPTFTAGGVDIISYVAAGSAAAPIMYCTFAADMK